MTNHYIVNVEAAVVRDGRYLIITRGAAESHAPGALSLPGGKVEGLGNADDVLEATLRREVAEEVGLVVEGEVRYVESKAFVADDGAAVVDVVFLCYSSAGAPRAASADEVAELRWMTAQEILDDPRTPPWTRQSIERAETLRLQGPQTPSA